MAVAVAHIHAEAVVRSLAVLQLDLGKHLLIALGLEDGLRDQALVPQRQIVRGHGQLAGGKHPAAALLGRGAQRTECVAIVGRASAWVSLASSEFHTECMPSGRKMRAVRKSISGCAGDLSRRCGRR